MPELTNSLPKWGLAAIASLLAGCSIHPIPDDVSRYDTAEIVRNVRCEAKDAVRDRIRQALDERGIDNVDPELVLKNKVHFERVRRRDPKLAATFKLFGASSITYAFDFHITENNNKSGSTTFTLPFSSGGNFTLLLDGQFDKTRDATRQFTTVETFEDLVKLECRDWVQPETALIYPLTGSIGVREIITTFINISIMGSLDADRLSDDAKAFTDTIKFTTEISGSIDPILKLDAVTDRFRLTNLTANKTSTRKDIHQVVVTLLFPDLQEARDAAGRGALVDLAKQTEFKALENSCVATERAREERFGMLRRRPPAIYCRKDDRELPDADR